MRRIHLPILLGNVKAAPARVFVVLFTLEVICRALMTTIVPLMAYEVLQDALQVSVLYFAVSIGGFVVALGVPMLLHHVRRRWILTLGGLGYVASAACYATGELGGIIVGLALQIMATTTLEVVINLFLMDHIPRRELNSFEPRRLLFSGIAFTAGPWLGVYLDHGIATNLTFAIVAAVALVLIAYFWAMRLTDNAALSATRRAPPKPLSYLPRFIAQPRLVLAWSLAVGRNSWWLIFFVYVPIFATQSGYGPEVGGAIVSLGVGPMIFVRVWGRFGLRFGIRRLLQFGYGLTGLFTVLASFSSSYPPLTLGLMLLAAFSSTLIDGAGNVPFLRAVHPYERQEMTSVFMTFRHGTQLFAPAVCAIALAFLPLYFVFVLGGVSSLSMMLLAGKLPRKL